MLLEILVRIMKLPKWTAAFCSLFVVNMFASGAMKVCGILFDSMAMTLDGFSGSLAGLIFVLPGALAHLIAPVVSVSSTHLSHRSLGSVGGALVGGSYICAGLFATRGLHFLFFSIIAGLGFGLLFLPSVLCLREQAMDEFASLMPLATIGTFVGISLLPGIVEVFVKKYGLRGSFYLFGALLLNTIPCGLLLSGGKKYYLTLLEKKGKNNTDPEPTNKPEKQTDVKNKNDLSYSMNIKSEKDLKDKHHEKRPIEKVASFLKNIFQEGIIGILKSIKSFALSFFSQFNLFRDIVFTLYFVTVNMRKFPSESWTLFLIPYNQELGLQKSTAVIISAIGGIGGILGRFLAAFSFKLSNKVSPLTLFAFYYFCEAVVFTLFDSWRNVIFMTCCGFASGLLLSTISGMTSGILLEMTTAETFTQAFGLVDFGCGMYAILTGYISGGLYDIFGSFKVVFLISALVCAVSGVSVVVIKLILKQREITVQKSKPFE